MHKFSEKRRSLGWRSTIELEIRQQPNIDLLLPISFAPPLVGPLLGSGAGGETQPSIPPISQPAPISTGTPSPNVLPQSSGVIAGPSISIVSSPTPSGISSPNSANNGSNGSNGSNVASALSSGGGGYGVQTLSVKVISGPSTTVTETLGVSTPAAQALASLSHTEYSGLGSLGTAASLPTTTTAATSLPTKQLSRGAILGITIACLFFLLALILLLVRHRAIARRVELRRKWWFGRSASGRNSSLVNGGSLRSPVRSSEDFPSNRPSARSSFATSFDRGSGFPTNSPSGFSPAPVPGLPPTAVVRERNSVPISTGFGATACRESVNSMLSNGSGPDTLTISTTQNNLEPSTLMSVRPFSPSESFAFPKPPASPSPALDSSFPSIIRGRVSAQSSATTLVPAASIPTSLHPKLSSPGLAFLPPTVVAKPSIVPSADPANPAFSDTEVVRRPFTPSLDDELAVLPNDHVRLLQIFDDGWVFVEKLAETDGGRHNRGLIPVDCFREIYQTLPTFLAEKMVSYGTNQLPATAI